MKVEIWSDIVCPFCYIGKRRFEKALEQMDFKDEVSIEFKSFQLNPHTETDPSISIHQYLAEHKGVPIEQAVEMNNYVTNMAAGEGLEYHMNKAVVANTFNAHRLLHFAKTKGLQVEMKERLMKGYFTEGKNVDDAAVLSELAGEIGIDTAEVTQMLESVEYNNEVIEDIRDAQSLRIQGVPFFVFERKYGVSGAQPIEVFLDTLTKCSDEMNP